MEQTKEKEPTMEGKEPNVLMKGQHDQIIYSGPMTEGCLEFLCPIDASDAKLAGSACYVDYKYDPDSTPSETERNFIQAMNKFPYDCFTWGEPGRILWVMKHPYTIRMMHRARAYLNPRDVTVVVSHFPCLDGQGALAVADMFSKYIRLVKYDIGTQDILDHKDLQAAASADDKIVFFDCAPPSLAQLEKLRERHAKVMVIDHHFGNKLNLGGVEGCFFDDKRSGCMLAWEYFMQNEPLPSLLYIIGERDLGKNDPLNKYVGYALMDKPPAKIDDLVEMINAGNHVIEVLLENGVEIAKQIEELKKTLNAVFVDDAQINGKTFKAVVVEAKDHRFMNELAEYYFEYFADTMDFVVFHYPDKSGAYRLSFRAALGDRVNVADIAKAFGGNGHRQSAGATVKELPSWMKSPKSKDK